MNRIGPSAVFAGSGRSDPEAILPASAGSRCATCAPGSARGIVVPRLEFVAEKEYWTACFACVIGARSSMEYVLRKATLDDQPALEWLIARAARGQTANHSAPEQVGGALS